MKASPSRSSLHLLVAVWLSAGSALQGQSTTDIAPIDWNKAKELYRRSQQGGSLSAEEQSYLDRAKEIRRRAASADGGGRPSPGNQRKAPDHLTPLSDMSASDRYEEEDGGLYGGGLNTPPPALLKQAREQLALIQPLDMQGKPSPDGTIVTISISMSNATMEYSAFKRLADASPLKSPTVTVVDCAQGGQAMAEWVPADGRPWEVALQRLQAAGVTPAQVQTAWIKLANKAPTGSFSEHLQKLEADTVKVLQNAKKQFPNLRIVYLGSRIWAGNAKGGLNPEPYAYESGFAARTLIQRQMKGDVELASNRAPLLLWGPYLWAEGTKGRKTDKLIWQPQDFADDGVHPSDSGKRKVAQLLLDFFAKDPVASGWFSGKPQN